MRCDEFRSRLQEIADGEFDDAHASECPACAEALSAARRENDQVADAVGRVVESYRPDPERRRSFLEGVERSRRPAARWWSGAAAAAVLVGLLVLVLSGDAKSAVDEYRMALTQDTEETLKGLQPEDSFEEELLSWERAAIETMLSDESGKEMSFDEAVKALASNDLSRRAAARRALAAASREKLEEIRSNDPYVNSLAKMPDPSGKPRPSDGIRVSLFLTVDNNRVSFVQYDSGVIHVATKSGLEVRDVWAHDLRQLQEDDPDFCKRSRIQVKGNTVQIGSSTRCSVEPGGFNRVRISFVRGKVDQMLDDLDEARWNALRDNEWRPMEKALTEVEINGRLQKLRTLLSKAELAKVEAEERACRRAREVKVYLQQLRKLRQ